MISQFIAKEDALAWMKSQENDIPLPISTDTYTEYYRCGMGYYSIRFNKRIKTYSVLKKKLKDGKYLGHYNGKTRTTTKLIHTSSTIDISDKWLKVYKEYFPVIVTRLISMGVYAEEAKDYAQEGFLKIASIDAKNDRHFKNIWMKRCQYDYWKKVKQIAVSCRSNDMPELVCNPEEYEVRMAEMLKSKSQVDIINLIEHGYSITDIKELTNKTFASISSCRNRAVKELRRLLKFQV